MPSSGKPGQLNTSMHPSYNGMSATLAPSALDNGTDSLSATTATSGASHENTSAPSVGLDFNFSQESNTKGLNPWSATSMIRENSAQGLASGQITPGADSLWGDFVQDGGWTEEATAS